MSTKTIVVLGILCGILLVCGGFFLVISREAGKTQGKFKPLVDVCQGGVVDSASAYSRESGIHPAMGIGSYSGEELLAFPYAVPADALAKTLAETELVVCLAEPTAVYLDQCLYSSGELTGIIERYAIERELTLLEAKSGTVIATETLVGAFPICPDVESFPGGLDAVFGTVQVKQYYGEEPSDSAMQEWLRPYVIIP